MTRAKQTKTLSCLLASLLAVLPVMASAAEFEDSARVLSVREKTERVNTPREECTTETVTTTSSAPASGERDLTGAVIGGLAGALLGSQVGKGNGKAAGAAVGAATGAIVGDRVSNSGSSGASSSPQTIQRCRTIDSWQTRSLGYEVTYEYHGRTYTETLPFAPGNRLRLHVQVSPQR
ncbi:MAG: hypothetical protein RIR70_1725 [Pseudomonadota bacterium]|jgi:uncharacterized protein YcfJ